MVCWLLAVYFLCQTNKYNSEPACSSQVRSFERSKLTSFEGLNFKSAQNDRLAFHIICRVVNTSTACRHLKHVAKRWTVIYSILFIRWVIYNVNRSERSYNILCKRVTVAVLDWIWKPWFQPYEWKRMYDRDRDTKIPLDSQEVTPDK